MHTTIPANSTARPDVSSDVTRGALDVPPRQQSLPVSGDDEQRVVHTDAQSHQQHQLVGEVGHAQQVAEQSDQPHGGPERHDGRQERQPHGEQGSEHEEQHDPRGDDPDARPSRGLWVGPLGDQSGDGHVDPRSVPALGGVDQLLRGVHRDPEGRVAVRDRGEGKRPVAADLPSPAGE
jgi:hypothetical protein